MKKSAYEKQYGIIENAPIKLMHRARKMFAIVDHTLMIAPKNANYSHADWFEKKKWITKTNNSAMETITRGRVDPNGDVYFYVGFDFRLTKKAETEFFDYLPALIKKFKIQPTARVFGGLVKGNADDNWPPRKKYGTIDSLLSSKRVDRTNGQ